MPLHRLYEVVSEKLQNFISILGPHIITHMLHKAKESSSQNLTEEAEISSLVKEHLYQSEKSFCIKVILAMTWLDEFVYF